MLVLLRFVLPDPPTCNSLRMVSLPVVPCACTGNVNFSCAEDTYASQLAEMTALRSLRLDRCTFEPESALSRAITESCTQLHTLDLSTLHGQAPSLFALALSLTPTVFVLVSALMLWCCRDAPQVTLCSLARTARFGPA